MTASSKKRTARKKATVSSKRKITQSLPRPERLPRTPYNASHLKKFKTALLDRKIFLLNNVNQMENETLKKSRQEASGDLSSIPIHIADIGTDNYEQDFTLGLIENENQEIQEINDALERIVGKTYGVCEKCTKAIPAKRLLAIPYARLCINCKEKEEH